MGVEKILLFDNNVPLLNPKSQTPKTVTNWGRFRNGFLTTIEVFGGLCGGPLSYNV